MSAATQAIKAYQDALAGETDISSLWERYYPLTVDEIEFIIAEAEKVKKLENLKTELAELTQEAAVNAVNLTNLRREIELLDKQTRELEA